jgi:hypothetical protein
METGRSSNYEILTNPLDYMVSSGVAAGLALFTRWLRPKNNIRRFPNRTLFPLRMSKKQKEKVRIYVVFLVSEEGNHGNGIFRLTALSF